MTGAPPSPTFARILAAQATFGFGWCLYLVQPKYLTTALGAGPEQVGAVGTTTGLVSIATIGVLLSIIDRPGGRRRAFLSGCVLLSLASLGYLFIHDFGPAVYLCQAGVAGAYGLTFNSAMALTTDVAPPRRLGQALGWQSAANLSMNAVSTLVAEAVADRFGWSAVFALALVAGLVSFAVARGLPRTSGGTRDDEALGQKPPYGALAPVFLVSAMIGAAFVAAFTFHQPFALALGAAHVGAFFVGFTAAALVMRLVFGGLGDRFGHRRMVLASLGLYAVVVAGMAALTPGTLWIFGAGMGLAHGVAYPTLTAFATEHAAPTTRGRIIAVFSGSFSAGTSVGALAWGLLAADAGYPPVFLLGGLALVLALVTLAAATGEHALPRRVSPQ